MTRPTRAEGSGLPISANGGNPTNTRWKITPLDRRNEQLAEDSGCLRRQAGGHPENPEH